GKPDLSQIVHGRRPYGSQVASKIGRTVGAQPDPVAAARLRSGKKQTQNYGSASGKDAAQAAPPALHAGPRRVVHQRRGSGQPDVDLPGVQGEAVAVPARSG